MARRKSPTFTEVELEFMRIIWEHEEVSTEDIRYILQQRGRELSDGSIRKVLSILVRKNHLTRRRDGRAYLYKAGVPQQQARVSMVQDLLKRAFGGSVALMALALLNTRDVQGGDLDEIKRLVAERESGLREAFSR